MHVSSAPNSRNTVCFHLLRLNSRVKHMEDNFKALALEYSFDVKMIGIYQEEGGC
jgi:hypothetical protein